MPLVIPPFMTRSHSRVGFRYGSVMARVPRLESRPKQNRASRCPRPALRSEAQTLAIPGRRGDPLAGAAATLLLLGGALPHRLEGPSHGVAHGGTLALQLAGQYGEGGRRAEPCEAQRRVLPSLLSAGPRRRSRDQQLLQSRNEGVRPRMP